MNDTPLLEKILCESKSAGSDVLAAVTKFAGELERRCAEYMRQLGCHPPKRPESIHSRYWIRTYLDPNTGCWLYDGTLGGNGYRVIRTMDGPRRTKMAHRYFYERISGPIPEGLVLDHLCRVRHCVNPEHLEPVTQTENALRGMGVSAKNAAKTHCPQDHPLSGENLYSMPNGGRGCRKCLLISGREHYHNRAGLKRPRKTHCKHGHELTPENTWFRRGGYQLCRICLRGIKRQAYQRNKKKMAADRALRMKEAA